MKKVGYFFFCFLPVFATIALQFLAMFPAAGAVVLKYSLSGMLSGRKIEYEEFMMLLSSEFSSQPFTMTVSVLYAVCGILLFGVWYRGQFQGSLRFPAKSFAKPGLILGLILLVPGLQLASSIITAVSASLFPGWMDFYERLIDTAGLSQSPSLLLILYAVILGPIAEEFTFRGVVLSSAKRALPFWAANLFQSLLFGIFHMNLIQGIYAFFIGLFLGYVCHRGGSIWLSAFLHMLFNFWGTCLTFLMDFPLLLMLLIPFGILGFFLFYKNTSPESIKHFPDFSDM